MIRVAALALVPLAAPSLACERDTLTGHVTYVRDGDTIELGEMAIRLQGPRRPSGMNPADARRARR
jgi:endonuclease YncB( thermonuclease family)